MSSANACAASAGRYLLVAHHRVQDLALARLRSLPVEQGVVDRRAADETGKHRGLRQIEVLGRLVVVDLRGRGAPPCAVAEERAVQIHLENLVLGELPLDLECKERFPELAVEAHLVADEAQLHELLSDRRGALHALMRTPVDHRRARNATRVDSRLVVEVAVLDAEPASGSSVPIDCRDS